MANNENELMSKWKKLTSNRAVVVTAVTLLVAAGIILAVTISANRAKKPVETPAPSVTDTAAATEAPTAPAVKDETLPTYNGGETRPVGAEPDAPAAEKFALPVTGKLQKKHDTTIQVYSNTMGDYRVHVGLDIGTAAEAPVYAAADGEVKKVWQDALMGTCVAIAHEDETVTIYKNLAKSLASGITEGVAVKQGQQIGRVGDTAVIEMADEPHLHFEMTVKGVSVNPLDYFTAEAVATLSEDTAVESSAKETAAMTKPGGK